MSGLHKQGTFFKPEACRDFNLFLPACLLSALWRLCLPDGVSVCLSSPCISVSLLIYIYIHVHLFRIGSLVKFVLEIKIQHCQVFQTCLFLMKHR